MLLFYSSYVSRPIVEQAIKGDWDFKLSAVYLIGILDFEYDEGEDRRKFMRDVTLKDQDGDLFYDKLRFKFLQMPLFDKTESELVTQQDKWVYFLKNLENFNSIPSILREPVFEKAFHTAELAAMCPTERERYEVDLQVYRDNMAVLKTAKVESEVKTRIEDIVSLLEDKFGPVPTSLVAALNATEDFAILKSLLIKASRCTSLEEFEGSSR